MSQRIADLAASLAEESFGRGIVLLRNASEALPLEPGGAGRVLVIERGTAVFDAVTARIGSERTARAAGVDRISLGGAGEFDLIDFGAARFALRTADGQYVTLDQRDPAASSTGSGEIAVFRLEQHGEDRVTLWHEGTGRPVTFDPDGQPRICPDPDARSWTVPFRVTRDGVAEAAARSAEAEVAVVVLAGNARSDPILPPTQDELIRAVSAANHRTIVIVHSDHPYHLGWADEHVPAILWMPRDRPANPALPAVLFGDRDPDGRLARAWYRSEIEVLLDQDLGIAGGERLGDYDYEHSRGAPLYPFGHGLSYTRFEYRRVALSATEVEPGAVVAVDVEVANHGSRAGTEILQCYARRRPTRLGQPLRWLVGTARVDLAPGQLATARIELPAARIAADPLVQRPPDLAAPQEAAHYQVMVGRSAEDLRLTADLMLLAGPTPDRRTRGEPLPAPQAIQAIHPAQPAPTWSSAAAGAVPSADSVPVEDSGRRAGVAVLALVLPFRPGMHPPVLTQFATAVVTAARRHDYDVLLVTADAGPAGIRRLAANRMVDGLILMDIEVGDPRVPLLRELDQPSVLIGVPDDPDGMTSIDLDFHAAGRCCVEELVRLGRRRLGFLGAPRAVYRRNTGFAHRTMAGFTSTCVDLGVEWTASPCEDSYQTIRSTLTSLLSQRPDLDGLVVHNESAIEYLLAVLKLLGRRVPDEVSIMAICPDDLAERTTPQLSSVLVPADEVGRAAVELLIQKAAGVRVAPLTLLEPRVTVRASTVRLPARQLAP